MKRPGSAPLLTVGLVVSQLVACGPGPASGSPGASPGQPYAGLDRRPIAALDPERVADLLAGRGAGYALAAELNGYPGPTHVLELGDQLGLSEGQRRATSEVKTAMEDEARRLGRELVELEEELDRAFESGGVTRRRIEELTAAIGRVEGRLRATHLAAHLAMPRILTPQQMSDYQRLRGYSGRGDPSASAAPHGSRGHPHLVSPQPP